MQVITNYKQARINVEQAAVAVGRDPHSIRIVGVAKRQPVEKVVAAVMEGLIDVAENRWQEASEKIPRVKEQLLKAGFDPVAIRWHMVGHVQSNKAVRVVELFDVVQSVDSLKLANFLSIRANDLGKTLEIFIEVNTSGEASKDGIHHSELFDLVGEIQDLPGLKMNGLMTVGPLTEDVDDIKASFDMLYTLRMRVGEKLKLDTRNWELSMGMSDDYPLAIVAGATMVRLGTAIFGARA